LRVVANYYRAETEAAATMPMRIVIVGCGVAGATAAFQARKTDRAAEITIVGEEALPEYSRCGLPYAFSGEVQSFQALLGYDVEFYEKVNRVRLKLGWRAVRIDVIQKRLGLSRTRDGATEELSYDSLILATGASATKLPIEGANHTGVFAIRTMEGVEELANHLAETRAHKVAVIGAGLTGSEMAEALRQRHIQVIQAEIVPEILPVILDPDMASLVRARGQEHGVEYRLGSSVERIISANGRVSGVIIDGQDFKVDAVVMAVKVKPNTDLATDARLSLGEMGGIKTNDRMETSHPGIYAVGDCAETYDRITRRYVLFQLATTAVRQALVAGANAAGGSSHYHGSTGVTTVKLFGLEVASFGPTTALANRIGLQPLSVRITGSTRLGYFPGGKDLTVKLMCDPRDGRVLGAQLVGEEGATLRANFVSMAGHLGMSVQALEEVETCYSPPLAPVWDPVTVAAQALIRRLDVKATRREPFPLKESSPN